MQFALKNRNPFRGFHANVYMTTLFAVVETAKNVPVVALFGSRRVGKTRLTRSLDVGIPVHYLDLKRQSDVAKLPTQNFISAPLLNQLVILDEVQRIPEIFPV